jgi:hypothetical protein
MLDAGSPSGGGLPTVPETSTPPATPLAATATPATTRQTSATAAAAEDGGGEWAEHKDQVGVNYST